MAIIILIFSSSVQVSLSMDSDAINQDQTRSINEANKWSEISEIFSSTQTSIKPLSIEYNDKLYTFWETRDDTISNGTDYDIVYRDSDGINYGSIEEITPINDSGGNDYLGDVAIFDDKLWITWSTTSTVTSDGDDWDIVYTYFDGNNWSPIAEITEAGDSGSDGNPKMISYYDKLYLFWTTNDTSISSGDDRDIVMRYNDGNTWSATEEVTLPGNNGDDLFVTLAEYDDSLYVAWTTSDVSISDGDDEDIVIFAFDGSSWSSVTEITPNSDDGSDKYPILEVNNNKLYLAWETNSTTLTSGTDWDIVICDYDGVSWSSISEINPDNNERDSDINIINYDNSLFAIWYSSDANIANISNVDDTGIVIRESKEGTWSEVIEITNLSDTGGNYGPSSALFNSSLFITWSQLDTIVQINYDSISPEFTGLSLLIDDENGGSLSLSWNSTTDFSSPITYNIYQSTNSASFDFSTPNYTTQNLNYSITGLQNGIEYYFVVRAEDSRGNEDNNTIVKSVVPTTTVDSTPPQFDGLKQAVNLDLGGQIFLNWSEGMEPDTVESNSDPNLPITYNIYISTTSGGQNFSSPTNSTQSLNFTMAGLTNDTQYFFVVRAEDSVGNEENNNVELSATPTGPPIDTDGDGIPDATDPDDDNDGVPDDEDIFPLDASEWADFDEDGVGDNADTDDDNDGVNDSEDAFPYDSTEDTDTDGDGVGDNADPDDDNDGVPDEEDEDPKDPNVGRAGSSFVWIVLILAIVIVIAIISFLLLQRKKEN